MITNKTSADISAKSSAPLEPSNVEGLQQQIVALEAEKAAAQEAYKRALADYKNLEFRSRQERVQLVKRANADLLESLIPTLDNLELTQKHFPDPSLKMIATDFWKTLESFGVTRLETLNQPFDAATMEAVDTAAGPEQTVVAEQRAGYQLGDAVLRHATVVVGNGQQAAAGNTQSAEKNTEQK